MRTVVPASVALGVIWNVIVVYCMGGSAVDALAPGWMLAGAIAGVAAGAFTVWSRSRREGGESVVDGVATYYLSMIVYWFSFVVIQRAVMCLQHGGWTDFDLQDHLNLIGVFLLYGTIWYSIILLPLIFLSRYVVWRIYCRYAV